MDEKSLEEALISLIDWIGRAEAANQMAMIKAKQIIEVIKIK